MTILVLEDDPSITAFMRFVLRPLGHAILEAATAEEAFFRFEESDGNIDLLIADVTLPVSSGTRVALELRSLLPYLRIILTSGYPASMWDEQDAAELSELPSDSIVTIQKPFAASQLREAVARFIGMTTVATAVAREPESSSRSGS